jgi:hypothetical protein
MLDKIKNIFNDEKKSLSSEIKETVNRWNLTEIDTFLIQKKEHGGVPYNDAVLGEILRRIYEVKRVNGEDEIEHKVYDKIKRVYTIPERTQKVIKIIQKISKSNTLGYKSNEIIFAIIGKYCSAGGVKEYEPELLPYYKMALERILLKTEIEQGLNLEFGSKK